MDKVDGGVPSDKGTFGGRQDKTSHVLLNGEGFRREEEPVKRCGCEHAAHTEAQEPAQAQSRGKRKRIGQQEREWWMAQSHL